MIRRGLTSLREMPAIPILVVAMVYFSSTTDGFLSTIGVQSILRDSAVLMVAAVGATLVFLLGGIDLTVGSTLACAGVMTATVMHSTQNLLLGVLAGLAVGVVVGALNGVFIGYVGLSPFVFTLALLLVVRAVAYMLAVSIGGSASASIGGLPNSVFTIGRGVHLGLPNLFLFALVVLVALALVLRGTQFGRSVYLAGDSESAARFNGIDLRRLKFKVYMFAAVVSSLAGVMLTFRLGSGNPSSGDAYLLNVIAATVIGGTSLFGGSGGVVRTAFGAALIAGVTIGLDLAGFEFWDQITVMGLVTLLGAALSSRFSVAGRLMRA